MECSASLLLGSTGTFGCVVDLCPPARLHQSQTVCSRALVYQGCWFRPLYSLFSWTVLSCRLTRHEFSLGRYRTDRRDWRSPEPRIPLFYFTSCSIRLSRREICLADASFFDVCSYGVLLSAFFGAQPVYCAHFEILIRDADQPLCTSDYRPT